MRKEKVAVIHTDILTSGIIAGVHSDNEVLATIRAHRTKAIYTRPILNEYEMVFKRPTAPTGHRITDQHRQDFAETMASWTCIRETGPDSKFLSGKLNKINSNQLEDPSRYKFVLAADLGATYMRAPVAYIITNKATLLNAGSLLEPLDIIPITPREYLKNLPE
jgi:hypothetical protein